MEWTDKEKAILKKYYFIEGIGVRYRLPNRNRVSIYKEVQELGLEDEKLKWKTKTGRINAWSEDEKEILKTYYPDEGIKVKWRFDKRTTDAICKMASKMGIKRNKKVA